KFIKLVTGEDILSEVEKPEGSPDYVLKNPVRIMPTRDGGIGMGPLNPFAKGEKVVIPSQHVIFEDEPDDEIRNAYNSQFGSGIVTAPASALNIVGDFDK
ncbi:MAG: hypothetical protein ACXADB_11690, partial [Candidatus Hermodarchaeia archaeon]